MDYENLITLLGNTGKDPETQTYENGGLCAVVTLATSDGGYTKRNGEQVPEQTQWHRIASYGRLAEFVARYIRKGARLYVRGKLKYYEAATPGGEKTTVAYIEADKITLLDRKQYAELLPDDVPVSQLGRKVRPAPVDDDNNPLRWPDGSVRTLPYKPGERTIKYYG